MEDDEIFLVKWSISRQLAYGESQESGYRDQITCE